MTARPLQHAWSGGLHQTGPRPGVPKTHKAPCREHRARSLPQPPPEASARPGGFQLARRGRPSLQLCWERQYKGIKSQPHDGAFKFVPWALLIVSTEWRQGWRVGAGRGSRAGAGGGTAGAGGSFEGGEGPSRREGWWGGEGWRGRGTGGHGSLPLGRGLLSVWALVIHFFLCDG